MTEDQYIFKIKKDEETMSEQVEKRNNLEHEIVVYTMFGKHMMLDDKGYPLVIDKGDKPEDKALNHREAFAYKQTTPSKTIYRVKINTRGRLFDPLGS